MKLLWFFLLTRVIIADRSHLSYTTLVTLGDSLSDTGNGYRISHHTWPPVPPFNANGTYSDGQTWNQIFTQQYLHQATLHDFTYGCATTDSDLVQGSMGYNTNLHGNYSVRNSTKVPGVRQQIADYINTTKNQTIDFDRTLYVIWVGINNYYYGPWITPMQTVQSIVECMNILIFFGARNIIIFNQPPFDRFPAYRSDKTNASKILYLTHNQLLAEKINYTRLNIRLFDVYTFISKIMDNYAAYGFENLDNCWDTESSSTVIIKCTNISKRMFADEFHPTTATHTLVARELYMALGGSNAAVSMSMTENFLFMFVLIILVLE